MSCKVCSNFSPPGKAQRVASDNNRWAELYECKTCGAYWDVEVLGWHAKEIGEAEARRLYPSYFMISPGLKLKGFLPHAK